MNPLDGIDQHILQLVQDDGRISNQELAERIGLSPSPTLRRLRRLESDGVISGYRAVVNPDALGLSVLASIEITLSDHSTPAVEHVERALRDNPSVIEAHMVAGDSDYLIKVRVRDLADFERFVVRDLRAIDHIGAIHTHFAFGSVKEAAPLIPPPKRRKRNGNT